MRVSFILFALLARLGLSHTATTKCNSKSLPTFEVYGTKILETQATERSNFTKWGNSYDLLPTSQQPISFCNITVTYTHPGQNDTLNAYIWLPTADNVRTWNERYLGIGGGGYVAGMLDQMPHGVALGYAVAATDGGHSLFGDPAKMSTDSGSWSLLSPGNADWVRIQNFASRGTGDLPKIAKEVIRGFYGRAPRRAYWNGCSTGGRQGLMSAQRFPTDYDGIVAFAPAINWANFVVAELWPQVMMKKIGYYPPSCELDALQQAAVSQCDALDGVQDGLIAAPGLCDFDATTATGNPYDCDGFKREISAEAAEVANAIWRGPYRNGKRGWYGNTHETPASIPFFGPLAGIAVTSCDAENRNCKPSPFPISADYVKNFVMKDPDFDVTSMTEEDFWRVLGKSRREFGSILGTDDPDLSEFKAAGGKMISWHGLADQLIPPNGTVEYYERVRALDSEVRDFYRYFEAPGVYHCFGGPGAIPAGALDAVVKWVEEGIPPESLLATSSAPGSPSGEVSGRLLCPYPEVAVYVDGEAGEAGSFECREGFGEVGRRRKVGHEEL
ncbi:tannase and feruloyl esterase [Teratosphaeria nubilosa]|uniref:Carboxylic ester hydrolase n=1 Tax=Teratosphaeria nubilosa TaxID=161662 RepID=A0A6G1L973_9PEZI|nr:tannase and feruloyl esterase [Teratosphaeria nubilosa]